MTAIPAQVAGVRRIVVACPQPNAALLAAAEILGVEEIAHIGGAQAIAALAYGTRSVPRVDKIFGPGNRYVTAAKRLVSGDCAIDMLAGPTEAIVLAAKEMPKYIAADLLAQAEHDPDAGRFLVTSRPSWLGRLQQKSRSSWRNCQTTIPLTNPYAKLARSWSHRLSKPRAFFQIASLRST